MDGNTPQQPPQFSSFNNQNFQGQGPGRNKPDTVVQRVMGALRKEYVVIGSSRVNVFRSWLAIGLVAGIAVGIIFVANRSGELEPSVAGRPDNVAEKKFVRGQILVKFKDNVQDSEVDAEVNENEHQLEREIPAIKVKIIKVPEGKEEDAVKRYRRNPRVDFAELDELFPPALLPNDALYPSQWHHAQIGSPAAWDITTGSAGVIAILDTGVDGTHPDLVSKMVPGYDSNQRSSLTSDLVGHGTKVAGVAAAIANNTIGGVGVSWSHKIMPVRTSDSTGYSSGGSISDGIVWAYQHGAKVINMSIGGIENHQTVRAASALARQNGVVVVGGSGNCSCNNSSPENPEIISVGGTDNADNIASWSSRGAFVDVSAPGVGIYTTLRGGGYNDESGTSFSGPIVAGVAALMQAVNSSLTPTQIESILETTAVDRGSAGYDTSFGYGRINAVAAVAAAVSYQPTTDTIPPAATISEPTQGSTRNGTVTVTTIAQDDSGISRVELRKNGVLVSTDSIAPYSYSWITTNDPDGSYSWQARAYDNANNTSLSNTVIMTVQNTAPPPPVPGEIIIDNGATGTSKTGTWTISTATGFYGTNSLYSDSTSLDTYRWTPSISSSAMYEVFMWWTSHPNRSMSGVIKIRDANGAITTKIVNQQSDGGKWNSLGLYSMGSGSYVETDDSNGQVSADAVKFTPTTSSPPADSTPPTTSITAPTSGSTVSGTISVNASASDNVGVTKVEFRRNGMLVHTDTSAPYSYAWTTTSNPNGSYTLQTRAYDAAGNTANSSNVTVNVSNSVAPPPPPDTTPPVVSINSAPSTMPSQGTYRISASATDNIAVTKMEIFLDSTLEATCTTGTCSANINVNKISVGLHTVTIHAYDAAGNKGTKTTNVTK